MIFKCNCVLLFTFGDIIRIAAVYYNPFLVLRVRIDLTRSGEYLKVFATEMDKVYDYYLI